MSNKKFQYRLVREKSLKNLPVEAGNFTVTSDTNEMFADINGKRVHIDRITEEELEVALEPKANKAEVYTKDEVDSQIKSVGSGAEEAISGLETKVYEDIEGIRLDLSNRYTKDEINSLVSAVFRFKGSVDNEGALPADHNAVGDVYNVNDTGANYAWDGKNWDKLSETIDLTPFSTKEELAAAKLDVLKRIWSNPNNPDAGFFFTRTDRGNGSYAKLTNETTGGGSFYYNNDTGYQSFAGVNDGTDKNGIYVQLYAAEFKNGTYKGPRISLVKDMAVYTLDSSSYTADDEIVVKGDIKEISESISNVRSELEAAIALKADKTELESLATKEEVSLKADKTDLTNLATKEDIANFIDNSVIEGLSAKDAELEAAIALKADKTDLENLEADLGEKLIHNGTLTIQKNGVTIGTFGANQSEDTLVNIEADQQVNSDWEAEEGASQILNKPTINSVELKGNVTLEDLGVQPAGDYLQSADLEGFATTEELETAFTSLNQMLVDAKTATGE